MTCGSVIFTKNRLQISNKSIPMTNKSLKYSYLFYRLKIQVKSKFVNTVLDVPVTVKIY